MQIELSEQYVLIVAVLVLWIGKFITDRVNFLEKYSIPFSVTGGLLCSTLVLMTNQFADIYVSFDLAMRDTLLLAFFSTVGVSAKFTRLKQGGNGLLILTMCAVCFLVAQDFTGVGLAIFLDAPPGLGLFAGSISLAGGHGTAIAWGQEAAKSGIADAAEVGIIFATLGLIAGGVIGGPIGEYLIRKYNLKPKNDSTPNPTDDVKPILTVNTHDTLIERSLDILFVLAVCMAIGGIVNEFLFEQNVKVPGFLTAMLVAIIITNASDLIKQPLSQDDFAFAGQLSLQLFLAMSLMSMDLSVLGEEFTKVIFVLLIQVIVLTLFAVLVIFRLMGRDYDAAVIVAGFCGLGMGATPVAIANMNAVTSKYGGSFKAFLLIPLVGAFFIDIANAVVIKFFLSSSIVSG